MEQEDYLKRQIDQLARILGKILADFIGLRSKGQLTSGIEMTDQALKSELDLDINQLIEIPSDSLIKTLRSKENFTNDNIGKLAEILLLVAESSNDINKKLYEKCLIIFEYLEKEENTYSLDRQAKIERIKNLL